MIGANTGMLLRCCDDSQMDDGLPVNRHATSNEELPLDLTSGALVLLVGA